jgi:quinol monooxygenase YgiN
MFTRIVECTVKPEKREEFKHKITTEVLPILQKQTGFVDEIILTSDTEPDRTVALSFWKAQPDAERYHRETFARIQDILRPFLQSEPQVRTFNVEHSTTHKIAASRAA